MAQDIVSDALNQIMNAKRVEKNEIEIRRISKVLIGVLELMKKDGKVEFEIVDNGDGKPSLKVKILSLNECRAIKPRYYTSKDDIEKYLRRFLPSRNFGKLVLSTNKGLITHKEAEESKIGGSLIAYFY